MLRSFSKSPTAILVTGITIGAIAGACVAMAAQPHMQAALGSLQAARASLVSGSGQQGRPSRTRDRLCQFRDRRNQGRHRLRQVRAQERCSTARPQLARRRAVMAKAKKTAPRKNKRPATCAGRQPARRPAEMGEGRRRRFGRRALRQRRVDLGRPAHGQAREAREQRGPRSRPARVRGPAPGLRLLDRFRARPPFACWPAAPSTWRAPCLRTRYAASRRRNCWRGAGPTSTSATRAGRRPRRCWPWRPKPRMRRAPSRASPTPRAPRQAGAGPR